jgi:hypothetical protein
MSKDPNPARNTAVKGGAPTKLENTKFLTDEFGIPERKAAEAVMGDGAATEGEVASLAAEVYKERAKDDPLAGVPTPKEPASHFSPDVDETALKPVLHRPNRRTGAG